MTSTLVEQSTFETADPDLACQWLSQAYQSVPQVRLAGEAVGDRPLVHLSQRLAAGISSADLAMVPQFATRMHPTDMIVINAIHSGTFEMYEDDHTVRRFTDDDVFVASGPQYTYDCRTDDLHTRTATVSRQLMEQVAGQPAGGPAQPWHFLAPTPVDDTTADLWRTTTTFVADLMENPNAADNPLLLGNAARMLTAAALTAFPNTLYPGEPAPADHPGAVPDSVRHATSYIDDHAHLDITLADIAEHVHFTPRAVQYAFRRHLDTTPMAYLRRVRLEQAHRELLAADPRTSTVTEIAMRWGFAHPGHFAVHYRDAYNTMPSTTLHLHT
ncbi:helix-turn-helix transcriptional regulator [Streptomyces populi]